MWVADDPTALGKMYADIRSGAAVSKAAALTQYGLMPLPDGTRVRVLELSTVSGTRLARIQLLEQTLVMVQTWTVAEWLMPVSSPSPKP